MDTWYSRDIQWIVALLGKLSRPLSVQCGVLLERFRVEMKTRSEVRKLILLVDKDEEKKMAWWSELNQGQRGESGQRQVNRMESDWLNLLRFLLTGGLSGNAVSNTLSASEQIRLIGPIRTTPLPFNDLLQLNCRSRTESKNTRSAPRCVYFAFWPVGSLPFVREPVNCDWCNCNFFSRRSGVHSARHWTSFHLTLLILSTQKFRYFWQFFSTEV